MSKNKSKRFLHKYDGKKYFWLRNAKQMILIFVIVFIVFRCLIGISIVKGDSMYPSFHDGQIVGFSRIVSHYDRGDVVSVRMPAGHYYVKRVIAIGGDTIDLRDGEVYVNDKKIEEPYVDGITEPQEGIVSYPYTLKYGTVFVMGDNRRDSMDSRTFGYILEKKIKGKIWVRD